MARLRPFQTVKVTEPLKGDQLSRIQTNVAEQFRLIQAGFNVSWTFVPGPYANGWLPYPANGGNVGSIRGYSNGVWYLKDPMGFVQLRGLVDGGTSNGGVNSTIFTLPVGFRPLYQEIFPSAESGRIDVLDNGDVRANYTPHTWISLSAVRFLAEG